VFLDREPAKQRRLSATRAAAIENLVGLAEISVGLRSDIGNEISPRGCLQRLSLDLLLFRLGQSAEPREDFIEGHTIVASET